MILHPMVVSHRKLVSTNPIAVQGNQGFDFISLSLDDDFNDLDVSVTIGCGDDATRLVWQGDPLMIPSKHLENVGAVQVSVAGFRDSVRVLTAKAPDAIKVIESGCYDGSDPAPEDPDLLSQLVQAAGDANRAADAANDAAKAAKEAVAKVDEAMSDIGDAAANAAAARKSAEAASKSASEAGASESSARASAESASADASSAASSEAAARQSATEAASSATGASQSATEAKASADLASTSASSASADAQTASQSASTAASAASSANEAAATVQSAVGTAQAAATSAQEDASTAQTAAETATAQAQAATVSATQAAQSATDAKASADTAAGWVPADGEPGQLLSKTDSGTAWVDPPSTGNVPKRTVSDLVAHAEDAYAQKPIEVRVKGRTVKNLWPSINVSQQNDWTCTTDETGLMHVATTTTTTTSTYFMGPIGLVPGKTYTGIVSNVPPTGVKVRMQATTGGSASVLGEFDSDGAVFTVPGDATDIQYCVACEPAESTSVDYKTRVMLVEGDTAPVCFVPTGLHSVEPGNLVAAGKNLLNEDAPAADGVVGPQLPPGDYALSGTLPSGASLKLLNGGADGETITDASSLPNSFTAGHPFTPYYAGVGGYATGLQLELGSTATAYEPPNVTTTPLPEVELRSLPNGTCDELVIKSDGTATVKRRTQLPGDEVTALPEPTTEPQSPVTLPTLPAPTFNVYHDAAVPSDTTVEYERDINMAIDNIQTIIDGLMGSDA